MAFPLEIVNISVIGTEILRDFYWQIMDIKTLNEIFLNTLPGAKSEAHLTLPAMPYGSKSIEILLYVFSNSEDKVSWETKRIQLCDCKLQQVPRGINHFQKRFDCFHRDLVNIWPSTGSLDVDGKGIIDIHLSYNRIGKAVMGYKLNVCEIFEIDLYFHMEIVDFDPLICVLTKTLSPVCVKTAVPPVQLIWMYNPFRHELNFEFATKEKSLKILEKSLLVKSGQTAPLLVQFSPSYLHKKEILLEMYVHGVLRYFSVYGFGVNYAAPLVGQICPKLDLNCEKDPFTIYPNYVPFCIKCYETFTKMVVFHNKSEVRVKFNWSKFEISNILTLKVAPEEGFVKPKHSKLCYITVEAKAEVAVIIHVPLQCKVFKSTKKIHELIKKHPKDRKPQERAKSDDIILRKLLTNVSVVIQANKIVDVPAIQKKIVLESSSFENKNVDQSIDQVELDIERIQAMDKWIWATIHDEEFLRAIINRPDEEFFNLLPTCRTQRQPHTSREEHDLNKKEITNTLTSMFKDILEDLSKTRNFIPPDECYGLHD